MTSVELYHFIYEKNSDDPSAPPDWGWYYTSSEDAFYYAGQLVQAVPISRTEIETKSNVQRESLEVSMSLDTDIAIQFLRYSPDHLVHLTLYDYEESGATKVKWKGRLAATKIGSSAVTLVFESVYVSIRSTMMTQKYQRGCRHMLYSDNCTMKRENWQIAVKIMSVNGYDLVMDNNPSATDGYFTGGVLELKGGMRGIMSQEGVNLKINDVYPQLAKAVEDSGGMGVDVILYPGCDRTTTTCKAKFNNLANFGGFPFIPTKNPFDGSIS